MGWGGVGWGGVGMDERRGRDGVERGTRHAEVTRTEVSRNEASDSARTVLLLWGLAGHGVV